MGTNKEENMSFRSQLVAVLVLLDLNRVNTFGTWGLEDMRVKTVAESVTGGPDTYCTDLGTGKYTALDDGKWCGSEKTEEGCESKFRRADTTTGFVDPCTWEDGVCKIAKITYKCPTPCFGGASTGFTSPSPPPVSPGGITSHSKNDCRTKWVSTPHNGENGFVKKTVCDEILITATGRRLQELGNSCEAYMVTCKHKTTEQCKSNDGSGVTQLIKAETSITAPDVVTTDQISFQCSEFRILSGPTDECACTIKVESSANTPIQSCINVPACLWDECDKPIYI